MATVQISSNNYSGQTANITFYPCSGGTLSLGTQVIPYSYSSDYYYGQYSLYFSGYNSTCVYDIPCLSPTPTSTPTNTPTVTPTRSVGITFSQTFTSGTPPGSAIENAWTTFRGQLTGSYTSFDFTSSNGSGYTVTDAVKVQTLATNLKNGTVTSVVISGVTWLIGCCACVAGSASPNAVEFSNIASCSGSSTAALRPFINNNNWGGIGSTVGAATQTLTLRFY